MEQSRGKKGHPWLKKILTPFSIVWKWWVEQTRVTNGANYVILGILIIVVSMTVVLVNQSIRETDWIEKHRIHKVGGIIPDHGNTKDLNINGLNFNVSSDMRTLTMRVRPDSTYLNTEFVAICPINFVYFVDSPKEHSLWVYITKKGAQILLDWNKESCGPNWPAVINSYGKGGGTGLCKEVSYIEIRMPKKDIPKYIGIIDNGTESKQEDAKVENKN